MRVLSRIILAFGLVLSSCGTAPKNFTIHYQKINTELDRQIDLEGFYVSEHGCDSTFYSMYMFYPDGLFTIATTSEISEELINCFEKGGKSIICYYPEWGTYRLDGDTIKTQTIRTDGGGCIIFRDYLVTKDSLLINLSDYVEADYTAMAYMKNYPSFGNNACQKPAFFYPLSHKRRSSDCPFIGKKWFKN